MNKRRIVFRRIGYRWLALGILLILTVVIHDNKEIDRYVFFVTIPPPSETAAGQRDLTQYEFGGHIKKCSDEDIGSCLSSREDARKFIEEHFNNQRRGYVIIEGISLGLREAHFFIEPNELGTWEIRVRVHVYMPNPISSFEPNMNTIYYTEVFRRPAVKRTKGITPGTSTLVLRSRSVYELVL